MVETAANIAGERNMSQLTSKRGDIPYELSYVCSSHFFFQCIV